MKKLFTADTVMVSLISAIGYGFGYTIPSAYGVNALLSTVICMVVGTLANTVAGKIIYNKSVQKSAGKRYSVFGCIILVFLIGYIYLSYYFAHSLWSDVSMDLAFSIVLPIVFFILSLGIKAVKRKKLLEKYGTGEAGYIIDENAEKKWSSYIGTNSEFTGDVGKSPVAVTKSGKYVGEKTKEVTRFLGIPYAKSPTGDNRWKKPIPVDNSDKTFEAFYLGNAEIQPNSSHSILTRFRQDEDCLNLNIWTAKFEPEAKKPVLVYFHGGDGRYGSNADPVYYLENIAKNISDAVFVGINYRFGVFGVVDFATSAADAGDFSDSDSLSIFDQIEALKWVKNNIAAFGGDAENITVAGDTSGGTCICHLAVIKEAKGLFKRALVLSASSFDSPIEGKRAADVGKLLLEEFGAKTIKELQSVSSDKLREFERRHYELFELPPAGAKLVPQDTTKEYLEGAASDIEFIFGIAEDDASGWKALLTGEISIEDLAQKYYEGLEYSVGEEKASKLGELLNKNAESIIDAKMELMSNFQYKVCILNNCRTLAKGNSKVKCFYWDVNGDIEKLKASSTSMVTTILGNFEIAEQMGYINNPNITEIMQAIIDKFIHGKTVEFYPNEVKGFNEILWDDFDAEGEKVLHIRNDSIKMNEKVFPASLWELEQLVFE